MKFDESFLKHTQLSVRRAPVGTQIPQTSDSRKAPDQIYPCLLRGLPFEAGVAEIASLFKDHKLVDNSIKIKLTENGRNAGLAAVLFQSSDALQTAFD